eukprot:SAG31_NODE_5565_length_2454_cov_1.963907_2_plen_78_part_00
MFTFNFGAMDGAPMATNSENTADGPPTGLPAPTATDAAVASKPQLVQVDSAEISAGIPGEAWETIAIDDKHYISKVS